MENVKNGVVSHRWFLYLTAFFGGMSVMAAELGASRLLAPYFSSSQIVWTIVIGVIMIAEAVGSYAGGRLADRSSDPGRLYGRLLITSVWMAAIPYAGKYIIAGVAGIMALFVTKGYLIWSALTVCLLIFFFPMAMLGTVTPSLCKYAVDSLSDTGKTVGKLGAVNTAGCIIGTFLPTFFTIPQFGTAMTFAIFAVILFSLAAVYFIFSGRFRAQVIVCAVLVAALCGANLTFAFSFDQNDIIYEDESIYNYLQVKDTPAYTSLATNVLFGVQSIKMKNSDFTGLYYDYALAAPVMAEIGQKESAKALIIGLGSGTYAAMCRRYFPEMSVEGVEIDAKIVSAARRYFALPDSVATVTGDGRAYLTASSEKYDLIMLDAYQDITIPFQMTTVEFFRLVEEHLSDGGVAVINLNMYSDTPGNINEYIIDTAGSVFSSLCAAKMGTNLLLYASDRGDLFDSFADRVWAVEDEDLQGQMWEVYNALYEPEPGSLILTDDRAPVELLGAKALDEMIGSELEYYRGILRKGGIGQLIGALK